MGTPRLRRGPCRCVTAETPAASGFDRRRPALLTRSDKQAAARSLWTGATAAGRPPRAPPCNSADDPSRSCVHRRWLLRGGGLPRVFCPLASLTCYARTVSLFRAGVTCERRDTCGTIIAEPRCAHILAQAFFLRAVLTRALAHCTALGRENPLAARLSGLL